MTSYIRDGIALFAIEMETEMRKKDDKYNDSHRSDINFLVDHLKEERNEVDLEVEDIVKYNLLHIGSKDAKTELVHEAIMCMLVYNVLEVDK